MAETAPIDANDSKGLTAASSADGKTPIRVWADPVSHRLLVDSLGGTIVGPGSSTDDAIVRWDGTLGTTIQDSSVTIDDSGNITTSGTISSPTLDGLVPYTGATTNLDLGVHALILSTPDPVTKIYSDSGMNPQDNVSIDIGGSKALAITLNGTGAPFFSTVAHTTDVTTGFNPAATNGVSLRVDSNEILTATGIGVVIVGNTDSTTYSVAGTPAVADGTYTVGNRITPVTGDLGTITIQGGIITAIQQAT